MFNISKELIIVLGALLVLSSESSAEGRVTACVCVILSGPQDWDLVPSALVFSLGRGACGGGSACRVRCHGLRA